jgi:hypothetical protein
MSDLVPDRFSLVAALADRFFVGVGGRADSRRRDRSTASSSGSASSAPAAGTTGAGRGP